MGVFMKPRAIALTSVLVVLGLVAVAFLSFHLKRIGFGLEAKSGALFHPKDTIKCVGSEHECDIRLNPNVIPLHYELYLIPNINSGVYSGEVRIDVDVLEDVDHIRLHAKHLTIDSSIVRHNGSEKNVIGKENKELEYWVIKKDANYKDSIFDRGRYQLKFTFSGSLTRDIVGLYRSSYRDPKTNLTKFVVSSKFQPTYARRAFPCFDEPGMKATFSISLVKPTSLVALSNMPIQDELIDQPSKGMTTVRFQKSVAMVTYLVAFAIGEFAHKETYTKRGTPVRIYTTAFQIPNAEYAVSISARIVDFYEEYFSIHYPLPKLDIVGIPDFISGAMEHWGMISFRETNLLFQRGVGSARNKQRIATVIAHELAHMWFGNLMTLKWWNDLWLNEGFASYIEYKGVNAVHPDWQVLDQFVNSDMQPILGRDGQLSSHPIVQEVHHPNQITELFDSISYSKGASVIRMLENIMGPTSFQKGVTDFLERFSFLNAVTADLWQALQNVTGGQKEYNITLVMDTWTRQMGFPLITIHMSPEGRWILQQERFLENPPKNHSMSNSNGSIVAPITTLAPYGYRWEVPISMMWNDRYGTSHKKFMWMKHGRDNLTLDLDGELRWIKLNTGQFGFYRVRYTEEMYHNMRLDNAAGWSPVERCGLLDDVFSLSASQYLDYRISLDLALILKSEETFIPWDCTAKHLFSLGHLILAASPDAYVLYRKYVITLIGNMYNKLSWTDADSDKHLDRLLKPLIFSLACEHGHEGCLSQTKKMFTSWLNDTEINNIPSGLRDTVYKWGMHQSDSEYWTILLEVYKGEADPQERNRILRALCFTADQSVIRDFLEMAKNEMLIKRQDFISLLKLCSYNPVGNPIVWEFYRNQYPYLLKRFTVNDRYFGKVISEITAYFASDVQLQELEDFLALYPDGGAGERARANAIEKIRHNIEWSARNGGRIREWLQNQDFSSSAPNA